LNEVLVEVKVGEASKDRFEVGRLSGFDVILLFIIEY